MFFAGLFSAGSFPSWISECAVCPSTAPGKEMGMCGWGEPKPWHCLVALLLNVPPHSAISAQELKLCSFPLLGGSEHHSPSSWLCLTPNSAVWGVHGAPLPSAEQEQELLCHSPSAACEQEFNGEMQQRMGVTACPHYCCLLPSLRHLLFTR